MKSVCCLLLSMVLSVIVNGQTKQCVLVTGCCEGDDEHYEMIPIEDTEARSTETVIYANQVPLVHYNGDVKRYPLELRIESDQTVEGASIFYYDFSTFSYLDSELLDDGLGFDKVAGDGTYTTPTTIVQSRDIRNSDSIYRYNLIGGTVTLTYAGGQTDEFRLKLDGYTIDGDAVDLDTNSLEIRNVGNFYYSENVVNCVVPQEYSYNQINFPVDDVLSDFKALWTDFNDDFFVFNTLVETNDGNVGFRSSANPFRKYILNVSSRGITEPITINHEINHFWVISSEFNLVSNHWRYIERPQSGFGYDCYNGVMTDIYEENGLINYRINEADNPHENFYNDIELNLMGALPVDSIDFPLTYFDRNTSISSDCNSTFNTLSDGTLRSLSKEEYIDFKATKDLEDISDGFDLKFIFLTEERITKEEHAMFEYLVLNYADVFKESTSGLINLNPEIYTLNSSNDNTEVNKKTLSIFPNPTNGLVTIDMTTEEKASYAIYDIAGKLCQTKLIINGRQTLDISRLSAGMYVLQVNNASGDFWTERIVKY